MNQELREVHFTAEEFERFPEKGFELVDGKPVEKHMGARSSSVAANLSGLLRVYNVPRNLGWILESECGYTRIFANEPNRVRKPDVSFVRRGRLIEDQLPEGWFHIAPDLAVEILSPNDSAREIVVRVMDFLGAKVPLIWVVDPYTRSVQIFRADGTGAWLHQTGELSGENVLPGFACRLEELFAVL
jgi:Uma2 family endonuclease